jgi:hypothetical protein
VVMSAERVGEMGPGQKVGGGCVNEKQRGVSDPGSGPKQAGGRNGLLATQREP